MSYVSFEIKPKFPGQDLAKMAPSKVFQSTTAPTETNSGVFNQVGPQWSGPLVRRPIQGIVLKERSPAYLSVIRKDGSPIFLNNSLGGQKGSYKALGGLNQSDPDNILKDRHFTDFTLLEITEERAEKIQVAETFGEHFVFMYGESPRILAAAGVLMNTYDFNWRAEFWENYDQHMRGTKLVEQEAKIYLAWDDVMVGGYMLNAQAKEMASSPHAINFAFSLLVTDYVSLAAINFSIYKGLAVRDGLNELVGGRSGDVAGSNGEPIPLVSPEFRARNMAIAAKATAVGVAGSLVAAAGLGGASGDNTSVIAAEALAAASAPQSFSDAPSLLKQEIYSLLITGPEAYVQGKAANAAGLLDSVIPPSLSIGPFSQKIPRVTPYQTDVVKGLTTYTEEGTVAGATKSWHKMAPQGPQPQMFTTTKLSGWHKTAGHIADAAD